MDNTAMLSTVKAISGVRNTKAKQLISHLMATAKEPVSLQGLFRSVQTTLPKTAYSTVFRIVVRLHQEGVIRRVDWRERGSHYEWAGMAHHHHVVCKMCGKVTDLDDEDLKYDEQYIREKTGYVINHHSIELEGICGTCQHGGMLA